MGAIAKSAGRESLACSLGKASDARQARAELTAGSAALARLKKQWAFGKTP